MTHYELLGLRPEATDAEVRDAISAARASWSRRRDASATPAALERATAALARLDEAARDLLSPEARRVYDEAFLPPGVLHRVRSLRGYSIPNDASAEFRAEAEQEVCTKTEQAIRAETEQAIRAEAEQAIRAEAERRREARRQEEERAALERLANAAFTDEMHDALAGDSNPGSSQLQTGSPSDGSSGTPAGGKTRHGRPAAEVAGQRSRKRPPNGLIAGHLDIDWRAVSVLALATAVGIGIALVPVALVTSGKTGAFLLSEAASDSESPRVLPATHVSATISQPPGSPPASEPVTAFQPASVAAASQAALSASQPASTDAAGQRPPATSQATSRASEGQTTLDGSEHATRAVLSQVPPAAPRPADSPAAGQVPPAAPQPADSPQAAPPHAPATSAHREQATFPTQAAPGDAKDLLQRAYAAYSSGNYPQSLRLYDQVLALAPRDPIARVARALTLLAMSRPRDAELECRKAIEIQPTMPEAHFNLGVALHRQNRDGEAVAAFRRFVDLAPEDRAAPQARGFIARWNLAMQASASRRPGR